MDAKAMEHDEGYPELAPPHDRLRAMRTGFRRDRNFSSRDEFRLSGDVCAATPGIREDPGLERAAVGRNFLRAVRFGGYALALAASLFTGVTPSAAAPTEYQVKAVFLFNFSQFVDWPEAAFSAPDAPLVIGVLGRDPFGAQLDEVVRDEVVRGHPLQVRRFTSVDEIDACHILFVSASEERKVVEILGRLKGRSILTVGDKGDFAQRGGMIVFVNERDRVRMRINLGAAEAAGLTLSSKLLRPAQIVEAGGSR